VVGRTNLVSVFSVRIAIRSWAFRSDQKPATFDITPRGFTKNEGR